MIQQDSTITADLEKKAITSHSMLRRAVFQYLSLEVRLGFAAIRYLSLRRSVLNARQIPHGVAHRDRSIGTRRDPTDIGVVLEKTGDGSYVTCENATRRRLTRLSSICMESWHAFGLNTCVGSGNEGSFSPGAAARRIAL